MFTMKLHIPDRYVSIAVLSVVLSLPSLAAQPSTADPLIEPSGFTQGLNWLLPLEETLSLPLPGGSRLPVKSVVSRPLVFERNDGQVAAEVAFLSRGRGYSLFLGSDEAVMVLKTPAASAGAERFGQGLPSAAFRLREEEAKAPGNRTNPKPFAEASLDKESTSERVLRMRLVDANSSPSVRGEAMLAAKANYFIGNKPALWRTNVPTFGKVRYRDAYPGIDLVYYGNEGRLEYDFVVAPGADPGHIVMEFEGADRLGIQDGGDLVLKVGGQEVRWKRPVVYQEVNGQRLEIAGQFRIQQTSGVSARGQFAASDMSSPRGVRNAERVAFELTAYDPRLPLVIDPILIYSSYLGGSGVDDARKVAVDGQGNVYIAGYTLSTDFPIKNALNSQNAGGGNDVFISKLTPAGDLLFSTYLGGTGTDAWAGNVGLAVAPSGQSLLVGGTTSQDFPVTNAVQGWFGGGTRDAFVASLTPDGDDLVFSTYLGGGSEDAAEALAVGGNGDIYVGGYTRSPDFPTTNAFQSALSSVSSSGIQFNDAFLTRISASGTNIVYSTFDGQNNTIEEVSDIVVSQDGSAFAALHIGDPVTGGGSKWATAKFNPSGSRSFERRWPTIVTEGLASPSIALAPNNTVVLAGTCWGPTLPAINSPSSGTASGYGECYIALFNSTNGVYRSATYLGGNGNDNLYGLQVHADGDLVVGGWTAGPQLQPSGFPVLNPLASGPTPGLSVDVFVAKYRLADLSLSFSTLFGGPGDETTSGIALDALGNPWIVGFTQGQLPTYNAFQSQPGGDNDAFLVNLSLRDAKVEINRSGQNVTLSWPVEAKDYILEATASLPAVSWTTVTNTPTVTATNRSVQLPLTGPAQFFRLRRP